MIGRLGVGGIIIAAAAVLTMRDLFQVISMAKMVFLVAILMGQDPFAMVGIQTPSAYTWAINNKMYACMMLFFVTNAVEGQMIATGAFEVSFNDVPVWSKLETGRVPAPAEMVQILDTHLKMSHQSDDNPQQSLGSGPSFGGEFTSERVDL